MCSIVLKVTIYHPHLVEYYLSTYLCTYVCTFTIWLVHCYVHRCWWCHNECLTATEIAIFTTIVVVYLVTVPLRSFPLVCVCAGVRSCKALPVHAEVHLCNVRLTTSLFPGFRRPSLTSPSFFFPECTDTQVDNSCVWLSLSVGVLAADGSRVTYVVQACWLRLLV